MPAPHVIVPGSKRQRPGNRVVIEAVEKSHQVSGDKLPLLRLRANRIDLILLVTHPRVGNKVFPLQHQPGIIPFFRNGNLTPRIVSLAPVRGRPVLVQTIERFEFLFQPILKLPLTSRVIRHQRISILIVDLPAHHVGVVAKMPRHLQGDSPAQFPILRRKRRPMRPPAVLHALTILFHAQGFRIF